MGEAFGSKIMGLSDQLSPECFAPTINQTELEYRGGSLMIFQEIIDSIESLSIEDQDYLFELIRKRRIENRRAEIAANAQEVLKAVEMGTAMKGTFEELKSYLLEDEEE